MLKILSLLLLLSLLDLNGQSSGIEISNDRKIVLNLECRNVKNRIQIFVENTDCDSIIVKSVASIWRTESCQWIIEPNESYEVNALEIKIYRIVKGGTIYVNNEFLKVRSKATMIPKISQFGNLDSISQNLIKVQNGISVYNPEWDITGCYSTGVKSFNCILIRDNNVIAYVENIGARFDNKTKKIFDIIETGDQLHFINIVADSPLRKNEELGAIKLYVK